MYRFLGADPSNLPALIQTKVIVQPWRTIYKFLDPRNTIEVVLTFSQPTSIDEPYTYITFDVRTLDEKHHTVRIYFEEGALAAVNNRSDKVYWSRTDGDITVLTMNAYNQIPFHVHGDGVRFNWGYAHLISENNGLTKGYQGYNDNLRQAFIHHQTMPDDDTQKPRYPNVRPPSSAFIINFDQVSSTSVSSYLIFLYDDVYSMLYFQEWQPPYWRVQYHNNVTLLVEKAVSDYQSNMNNITDSNELLMTLLNNTGGYQYALLGSLVTRQITAALTKTWSDKYNRSLLFLKEVGSGGAISTVDVIFPSSPFFLWLYPEMLRDALIPVLLYANNQTSIHYNLPWAPHHL